MTTEPATRQPSAESLAELERLVDDALRRGDDSQLTVLGYGEITTVLAWPEPSGPWACKRLPVFEDRARFDAYARVFDDYLAGVRAGGTAVVDSRLHTVELPGGRLAGYCVQPVLAPEVLARNALAAADPDEGRELLRSIARRIEATISPTVGLDGQLTNWGLSDGEPALLDVTTPFLRDADGRMRLDLDLFLAALPAVLTWPVKKLLVDSILGRYFEVRSTVVDLAANLRLAGLSEWVPAMVEVANAELGLDLTEEEVARYYRSDARLWQFMLWVRRVDRTWQRRVRRRPYPFLLPGPVDRHL